MTPSELSDAVVHALRALVERGAVELTGDLPESVVVERPRNSSHGDYATNVALQLGKRSSLNPPALAAALAEELAGVPGIASVDVAGPGFLNITFAAGAQGALAATIVAAGAAYGRNETLAGRRVNVEFYVNDRGNQMDKFGASVEAAAEGRPVPQDGYHGDYIADLARQVLANQPGILELPAGERLVAFREEAYQLQLAEQRRHLETFRTHFDVWFSERSLYDEGKVEHGLKVLEEQGHLYESEGALWMRTTDFGDDKDRVLRRGNGELTYFASDTAYYVDKRERGFDVCIYLLGADHHGYVGRLRSMAACAGDDPSQTLEVLIGQLVKILRGGEEVRLSKRAGTLVTLEELVELIGVDALRYTLARYPTDSPLTIDVEQITRASNDNPVFYVQYAHARLASILRNAGDLGVVDGGRTTDGFDPSLLAHPREGELLRALAEFPRVVAAAAQLREPHRVARFLEETAGTFHRFYDACRVLPQGDEEPTDLHRARLVLVDATRTVLANGLRLLGVDAPERM